MTVRVRPPNLGVRVLVPGDGDPLQPAVVIAAAADGAAANALPLIATTTTTMVVTSGERWRRTSYPFARSWWIERLQVYRGGAHASRSGTRRFWLEMFDATVRYRNVLAIVDCFRMT